MKQEDIDKTVSILKSIDNNHSNLEQLLLKMQILSRNDMLKEITKDIINKNEILQEPELNKEPISESMVSTEKPSTIFTILDSLISNIQNNPSKRVLYLRLFLDRFHDISEQDKNVILQSLKDESVEKIKERLLPIIKNFNLML